MEEKEEQKEKESELIISTNKQIEALYDQFIYTYDTIYSKNVNLLFYSMLDVVKIEKRNNILEIGCGTGVQIPYVLQRKQKNSQFVASDISQKMIQICKQRVGNIPDNGLIDGSIHEIDFKKIQSEQNVEEIYKIEKHNLILQKINAEEIPYDSDIFDCYISNLCLQVTENPTKMISEAYRVLQSGCPAIFSVWGRQEFSSFCTLSETSFKKYFPETKQKARNYFHLNDRQKLIESLEQQGFQNILAWYQFIPYNFYEFEDFRAMIDSPGLQSIVSSLTEQQKNDLTQEVFQNWQNFYKNNKAPSGLEGLIIIGYKK